MTFVAVSPPPFLPPNTKTETTQNISVQAEEDSESWDTYYTVIYI